MSNLATITNNILADSGIDDINVVVTTGSYANPAWITSLAWTKITGVPSFQLLADKGQPNGYASLDSNGKVPLTQINDALIGNVNFQGLWNASTNTPTLVNPPSAGTKGYYYIVSVAGTFASITFEVGDWIISTGSAWGKVDNTDSVSSVFGRTGNVAAANGDYNTSQVTESGNLYYTDARARAALSFAAGSGAYNTSTGVITIPTDNNQIANGAGYITSAALSGYVPTSRTITINGTTQDLSANRTFNVGTVTSVTASSPLFSSGGTTPNITIQQASGSQSGFLSSTDWTTFNNKQNALTNPVTGTGTTNYLPKFTGSTTIGNSQVFDNGTNVGVGTASPSTKLDVRNAGAVTLSVRADGITGDAVARLQHDAIIRSTWTANRTTSQVVLAALGTFPLAFHTNGVERIHITSGGNVLIGTQTDGVRLVNSGAPLATSPTLGSGTIGADAVLSANGLYGLYTGVSSAGHVWMQVQRNDATTPVYALALQPAGGGVLIGTTTTPTPVSGVSFPLTIISSAATRLRIDSTNASPNSGVGLYANGVQKFSFAMYGTTSDFTIYNDALLAPSLVVKGDTSNVLIGTTTSTGAKLEINGDIRTGALGGGYVSGYWKMGRALLGTQPTEDYQIIVEINGDLFAIGAVKL